METAAGHARRARDVQHAPDARLALRRHRRLVLAGSREGWACRHVSCGRRGSQVRPHRGAPPAALAHHNRECPMKALAISMVAGAALCSLVSVPALAMPLSNLAAAASDLALGQSVRYLHHHYRYRLGRSSYYAYGAAPPPWSRRFGDNRY